MEINQTPTNEPLVPQVNNKKKLRRGISNETRSTSFLKFSEKDATRDMLFIAHIKEVTVSWAQISTESKGNIGAFAGYAIPRFDVHFVSNHAKEAEQRHVHLTINPVASNVDTIPGGKDEMFLNGAFGWIKHILECYYLKGRQLTPAEEDALTLTYQDYDEDEENITYVPVEVEEVIAGWRSVFENAVAMLNGTWTDGTFEATGKPCYKDANGKNVNAFIKLLRYYRTRNKDWKAVGNNGDLAFPSFVGEGCIEIMTSPDALPKIIKVNPINESITPKQEAEAKAPSMPGNIPGGMPGVMGGVSPAYAGNMNAYDGAATDMPF